MEVWILQSALFRYLSNKRFFSLSKGMFCADWEKEREERENRQ
jgi:hypothetical protein